MSRDDSNCLLSPVLWSCHLRWEVAVCWQGSCTHMYSKAHTEAFCGWSLLSLILQKAMTGSHAVTHRWAIFLVLFTPLNAAVKDTVDSLANTFTRRCSAKCFHLVITTEIILPWLLYSSLPTSIFSPSSWRQRPLSLLALKLCSFSTL